MDTLIDKLNYLYKFVDKLTTRKIKKYDQSI